MRMKRIHKSNTKPYENQMFYINEIPLLFHCLHVFIFIELICWKLLMNLCFYISYISLSFQSQSWAIIFIQYHSPVLDQQRESRPSWPSKASNESVFVESLLRVMTYHLDHSISHKVVVGSQLSLFESLKFISQIGRLTGIDQVQSILLQTLAPPVPPQSEAKRHLRQP